MSTLTEIVAALSATHDDKGVMVWLTSKNEKLRSKPDGNWACSPQEYISAGHIEEVADLVREMTST